MDFDHKGYKIRVTQKGRFEVAFEDEGPKQFESLRQAQEAIEKDIGAGKLTCRRCGYKWTPRVPHPVACPDCQSRKWDKEKETK